MQPFDEQYPWESFPEYVALRQYSRCLGRVLASLPRSTPRRITDRLIRLTSVISMGLAGAHAELPAGEPTRAEREEFLHTALEFIDVSRESLRLMRAHGIGDAASVMAALELLERVETGLRARPLPD